VTEWDTEDVFAGAENLVTIALDCIPFTFNGVGSFTFGSAKRSPAVSVDPKPEARAGSNFLAPPQILSAGYVRSPSSDTPFVPEVVTS
jgi:hypothetical protein